MIIEDGVLCADERAALALRRLYSSYGYTQYKMNKFEEYDLYVRNKDFLISDHVITFTDTNGKLMALKPDVTLSIVKNSEESAQKKVYYQENVYRVSGRTKAFREIMQVGLECIGEVDSYCLLEVLTLAARSLQQISRDYVLDISHLGIVSAVLDGVGATGEGRAALLRCIGEKNRHELARRCAEAGIDGEGAAALEQLISVYGEPTKTLAALRPMLSRYAPAEMLEAFSALLTALAHTANAPAIRLDFSVVGDMRYYSGIVFKGFVDGASTGVLSGGEYNGLMQKMGKREGAIGFAVYLDALERLANDGAAYDVDTVVLYDGTADLAALQAAIDGLTRDGATVLAARSKPNKLSYRRLLRFDEKEGGLYEVDA